MKRSKKRLRQLHKGVRSVDRTPVATQPLRKTGRKHHQTARPARHRSAPEQSSQVDAPFPVVGIGASAGGLEALSRLFRHLPATTGMAFIAVQHLDPTHESALVELLSRISKMPITEVTNGLNVEPDHAYVIPPNTNLTIAGGVLHLTARQPRELHLPINDFLRSLAADQRSNAIGVILSGTASDGTLGLEAIKLEGGITFAQDMESAKYDGMPRSAVSSGCVDFVLPPEGIARELVKIAHHPYLRGSTAMESDTLLHDDGSLAKIFALLHKSFGVDFRLYRQTTVRRRILRRMLLLKTRRLDDYVKHLRTHADELLALYGDLLIGVTSFFREAETLDLVNRKILPRLLRDRTANEPVRAWVAGCSTGEEAYSLAITLVEFFEDHGQRPSIQIFGTDVNEAIVQQARAGVYSEASTGEIPETRLRRFFTPVDGRQQVAKRIRDLCVFAKHDLTKDPPFSNMDLITCCNVLIYLQTAVQDRILQTFHYALKPTGMLMLGRSESVGTTSELFTPMDRTHKIYSRKASRPIAGFRRIASGRNVDVRRFDRSSAVLAVAGGDRSGELEKSVQRLLLTEYAPPGIVVNDQWEVVHFTGHPNPYIQPSEGAASFSLLKMAREGLALELRALISEAKRTRRPVRKEGIRVTGHGHTKDLTLKATPIRSSPSANPYVMVVFESAAIVRRTSRKAKASGGKARSNSAETEAAQLKRELAAAREYLNSVVSDQEAANEELKSANEEILSSNEELQSTNEELETAKEELQSTNEELNTLNEELQHRNVELRQLGNDLANLVNSIQLPIVMLGRDLRIRRFTPMAERVLRLHGADIGRPIGDVKLTLDVADLEQLIMEVIETVAPKEQEVQDLDGRWYTLSIRPYRTMDHEIHGALLVLSDIDQSKRHEREIAEARDYAEAIIKTVREPLVVLDEGLRVVTANPSFYEFVHMTPHDTERQSLFALDGRKWDIPVLSTLLSDVFTAHADFENFEVVAELPGFGERTLVLNAREVHDTRTRLVLVAFDDVTERREAEREHERLLEREQAAKRAAELANQTKDDFLAVVSHELRTPLNVLLGWIWRLRAGNVDDATVALAMDSIERNAKLQAKLVEDLLDYSRIGRGTLHLELVPLELPPIIDAALVALRPLAEAKNIRIEAVLPEQGGNVMGDGARLQQVVWNLLNNAVKFTPPAGRIAVRLERDDGALRLHISDTGKGISAALLPHIFKPFRQGDDPATSERQGLGLGLAIVKTIVEGHAGTVYADSPGPGQGATFTITLPALAAGQTAAASRPVQSEAANAKPDLAGVRALVVADDAEARELLTMMLQAYGASVTAVGSAREALQTLQRDRSAVLLSDIHMADEDGYWLMGGVRALDAVTGETTPALAVTAYSSEDRERLVAAGFHGHVPKPVDAHTLAAMVADLVSERRS